MKRGQSWKNMRDSEYEVHCNKLREVEQARFVRAGFVRTLVGVPLFSEIRMLLASRYREGTSCLRVLCSVSGKRGRGGSE